MFFNFCESDIEMSKRLIAYKIKSIKNEARVNSGVISIALVST